MQVHVLHLNVDGHPVFATLNGICPETLVENVVTQLRAQLGDDCSSLQLHHFGTKLALGRSLHASGIHDGDVLVAVADNTAHLSGDVFLQPYGALPNSSALKDAIVTAQTALLQGAVPHIAAEGAGGTYFLPSTPSESEDDEQQHYSACFKPRDEELGAPANPRGRTGTGHMGVPLAERDGFYVGEAFVREAAAYVLDQLWGGHACVPPTTLVEARHPAFSNISHPYLHKVDGLQTTKAESSEAPAALPKLGSFQLFVNDAEPMCEYGPRAFTDYEVQKLALFDLRTMNSDRNDENVLFQTRSIPVERADLLDADVASKAAAAGLPIGPSVNPWEAAEAHTSTASAAGKTKAVKVTIPLDHGLTLPDRVSVYRGDWMWSSWAQCKKPLHPVLRRSLEEWDVERDIRVLKALFGPKLRPAVYQVLRTTHAVLKSCILEGGMTLAETAVLMGRKDMDQPSSLERIIAWAKERATEQAKKDLQSQQQQASMSVAFAPASLALGHPLAGVDSQVSLALPSLDSQGRDNVEEGVRKDASQTAHASVSGTERPEIGQGPALTTHSAPEGSVSPAFGLFSPDSPGLHSAGPAAGGSSVGRGSASARDRAGSTGFTPSSEVAQGDGSTTRGSSSTRPAPVSLLPPVLPSIPEGSPSHSVLSMASSVGTDTPAGLSAHPRAITQAVHIDVPSEEAASAGGILGALSAHVDRLSAGSTEAHGQAGVRQDRADGGNRPDSTQAIMPVVDLTFAGRLCALSAAQAGGAVPGRKRPRTIVMQGQPVLQCVTLTSHAVAAACCTADPALEEQVDLFVGLALSTDPALVGSRRHAVPALRPRGMQDGSSGSLSGADSAAPSADSGLTSLFEIGPMELAMSVGVALLGKTTGLVAAASAVALGKGVGFASTAEIAEAVRSAVSAAAASFRARQTVKQRRGIEERPELEMNDGQSFRVTAQSVYASLPAVAPLPCLAPPTARPLASEPLVVASGLRREDSVASVSNTTGILQPFGRATSYNQFGSPSRQGSIGGFLTVAVRSPYVSRMRTISRAQTSSFDLYQTQSIAGRVPSLPDSLQLQDTSSLTDATAPLASSSTPLTTGKVFNFSATHVDGSKGWQGEGAPSWATDTLGSTRPAGLDSPSAAARTRTFTLDASSGTPEPAAPAGPAMPRLISSRGFMMQRQASLRRLASGLPSGDSHVPSSPGNPSVPVLAHPVIRRSGSSNLSRAAPGSTGSLSSAEGADGHDLPPLQLLVVAAGPVHLSAVADDAAVLSAQAGSTGRDPSIGSHSRAISTGSSGRVGSDSGTPQMRARDDPLVAAHVAAIAACRDLGVKTGATALRAARLVPSTNASATHAQAAPAGPHTPGSLSAGPSSMRLALPPLQVAGRQVSMPEALSPVPAMLGRTSSEGGFMSGALWDGHDTSFIVPAAVQREESEEQEDIDHGEDASTSGDEEEEENEQGEHVHGGVRSDAADVEASGKTVWSAQSSMASLPGGDSGTFYPSPSEQSVGMLMGQQSSEGMMEAVPSFDEEQEDGPPLYILTATLSHCKTAAGQHGLVCRFEGGDAAAPALRILKHAWRNSKSQDVLHQQVTPRQDVSAVHNNENASSSMPTHDQAQLLPVPESVLPAPTRALKPSPVLAGGGLKRVGAFASDDVVSPAFTFNEAAFHGTATGDPEQSPSPNPASERNSFGQISDVPAPQAQSAAKPSPLLRAQTLQADAPTYASAAEGLLGARSDKIVLRQPGGRGGVLSVAGSSASKSGLRRQASHTNVAGSSFDLGGSLRLGKLGQMIGSAKGNVRVPTVARSASLIAGDGSGLNGPANVHAHASTTLQGPATAVPVLAVDPGALQARQEELSLRYVKELVAGYISGVQRKKAKQSAPGGVTGR